MGAVSLPSDSIRHIPLYYDNADSHNSALSLILTLRPEWRDTQDTIEFVRFTDGITNTLLKAINKLPGLSEAEIDNDSILLRAYGRGTDVLIDREKETSSHTLLAQYGLAPQLFARFENGLLYKYISGSVCSPADLRRPEVWRGVAQRLGQWHAVLPISSISSVVGQKKTHLHTNTNGAADAVPSNSNRASRTVADSYSLTPDKPIPNVWTTMQKWIFALPTSTKTQTEQRDRLQSELEWLVALLRDTPGVGDKNEPFVFAHCDLLSGNVIVEPTRDSDQDSSSASASPSRRSSASDSSVNGAGAMDDEATASVSFIDYEYATPAPASFDIANHFAEWGGFDCDFSVLPTRSVRRAFLREYLASFNRHHAQTQPSPKEKEKQLDELFEQVDLFRGVPGLYWGIWALIQAQISLIEFDYANYAEVRLGEYWAWKDEFTGQRARKGGELGVREKRWAQE